MSLTHNFHEPRQSSDEFLRLKTSLLHHGRLFEDPEFPAGSVCLGTSKNIYEWRRPKEIVTQPKFIKEDMKQSDLFQGQLRNCWFIAAAACMASAHTPLLKRCIPDDQEFHKDYAGIFCFHFWRFGEKVEVIIDDRLPTSGGRLVFGCNKNDPSEFWVPLFEKAFAKFYGNYNNLNDGFTTNALVDFTGGISELIELRVQKKQLDVFYHELYTMMQKSSMFGAHISGDLISEKPLPNGLYRGHAYSIVNFVSLHSSGTNLMLLQLRNPWGKKEWNGPWSDGSPEWNMIPEDYKRKLSLIIKEDGDFWMEFTDFVKNFEFLTICHLDPDAAQASGSHEKKEWKVKSTYGKWIKGFSAGGCGNYPYEKYFWKNPQFNITVGKNTERQKMIISLLQEAVLARNILQINFKIYRLLENENILLNSENETRYSQKINHPNSAFINMREVTDHFPVEPGQYVIIPCTYKPNQNGNFLLRVYTEDPIQSKYLDINTSLSSPFESEEHNFENIFHKATKGDKEMDPFELSVAINDVLNRDGLNWSICTDTARDLLRLSDTENSSLINLVQFSKIMKEVLVWKEKFKYFDRDLSGDIDTYEISQLFKSIGFTISRQVLEAIFKRYGGKKCRLSFEDFIHASCRVITHYKIWMHKKKDDNKKICFGFEEWLSTSLYY